MGIVYLKHYGTLNEATVLISDYIDFCITTIIKEKEVTIYPNNKPWMSKEIKGLLKQKEQAARENDKQMKRTIQKEIDSLIRHGKQQFGKRIKNDFKAGNPKKALSGLKKVIGSSKKQDVKIPADTDPMVFANNLNNLFNRFDINQSNDDVTALKHALVTNVNEINELEISTSSVEKVFRQININKAAGPDLLSGKIFKLCYGELAPVFSQLYNWSLN